MWSVNFFFTIFLQSLQEGNSSLAAAALLYLQNFTESGGIDVPKQFGSSTFYTLAIVVVV